MLPVQTIMMRRGAEIRGSWAADVGGMLLIVAHTEFSRVKDVTPIAGGRSVEDTQDEEVVPHMNGHRTLEVVAG